MAYAGTVAVGNVVLQWYLTGRHLSPRQVRDLYRQALAQGKHNAQNIIKKLPKPRLKAPRLRLPGRKKAEEPLPLPPEIPLPGTTGTVCPECGQSSAIDAQFCQYCGKAFEAEETNEL